MASAEVAARPSDRHNRRRPFTQWMKRLANLKGSDTPNSKKGGGIPLTNSKNKKGTNGTNGNAKNNPYPESGHLRAQSPASSANGHHSFSTPVSHPHNISSHSSLPRSVLGGEKEAQSNSNKSNAPTVATNPETVNSDTGHSKAMTTTTNGGALSTDGAGRDSTFSSPNQSEHSLSTTLTTIQSSNPLQQQGGSSHPNSAGHAGPHPSNPSPNVFSHQYPVSPSQHSQTASALPPHMSLQMGNPSTYNAATANGMLSDNASILTLASSSKRRRRSMDTDASMRALAPSSVWGGSRESLPLSVLSGHADAPQITYGTQSRPLIGGIASAERASVYSSQGVTAPALANERNSYYSKPVKDLGDAKSLRSITNLNRGADDARSLNADAKSFVGTDVASLRGYEGSMRSGALGHGRNDSIPGSIGSPLASPVMRQAGASGALSRRSSDWHEVEEREEGGDDRDEDRAHENAKN